MEWILIALVIFIVMIFTSSSDSKAEKCLGGQEEEDENWIKLESVTLESEESAPYMKLLTDIYRSGETLYDNSVASNEEIRRVTSEISTLSNEHDIDYLTAINFELLRRDPSPTAPSTGIELNPREKCYFKTKNSILNVIKKITRTVTYTGFRYNVGAFRSGSMTLNSNDIQGYSVFGGGCCYVTNQRIIFKTDDNKNKVISLGSILSYALYGDTAVLLCIANSTPVIINFPCTGMFNISSSCGAVLFMDDKIQFLYALDEVLEKRRKKDTDD